MRTLHAQILIVDDDKPFAELLARHLHRGLRKASALADVEFAFEFAETLSEGIRKSPFANATFLDLQLRDAEPSKVIESIRLFRPPVVICTGDDNVDVARDCVVAGAKTVFVKPVLNNSSDIVQVAIDCIIHDIVSQLCHAS